MSKKRKIPLPLIALGYVFSPPAGVVLTLLRVFTDAVDGKKEAETPKATPAPVREKVQEKTDATEKMTAEPAAKRSGISVPALVLGIFAILFLLCAGIGLLSSIGSFGLSELSGLLVLLFLAAACGVPSLHFKKQHDERNVIRSIIGKRETILLSQLVSAADMKPKKLRKALQSMINKGEFGEEAYIDLSSGRFMRHPDEMEEMLRQAAEMPAEPEPATEAEGPDNFRAIILQIRKRNDDIKDYAVSERIYRIEEHTQNIFDYVTAHPEAMPQIRSFMNYYLPTTLKLLDSYSRIEQMGVAGENMKKSKENIEQILDALVVGFEQQVDKLFANESIDISSEISVLETMMKQDGLDGRSDFAPDLAGTEGYTPGFTDDLTEGGMAAQAKPE